MAPRTKRSSDSRNASGGPITIRDVAREASVSPATVSRVINAATSVAPETVERVRAAVEKLNFVPSAAARSLSRKKTDTIGVLFPDISGPFFPGVIRGIEEATAAAGYHLLIYSTALINTMSQPRFPLDARSTDGLIIGSDAVGEEFLRQIQAQRMPTILLHRGTYGMNLTCVTVDNRAGAQKAVEHLLSLGRRRVVHISGPADNDDAIWRERGYRETLEGAGIGYDPALVFTGSYDEENGVEVVERLIGGNVSFDAIFAANDEMAIGAIQALHANGCSVPHDVAVVGFGDIPLARYVHPALTTVHIPIEELGKRAAELLLAQIAGTPPEPMTVLPVELVIRQSSR